MKINNQNFYKFLYALLGFIIVILFIWFRFLRERLPRDIPFTLNWISLLFVFVICISYIYITFKILKQKLLQNKYSRYYDFFSYYLNKNNKDFYLLKFIVNKLKFLFTLLLVLHNFLMVDLKLQSFFINVFLYFNHKYHLYDTNCNEKMFLLLDFFPKLIMLSFFLLDVFYFKKLNIFYYSLILGVIPLMYSYLIYIWINYLEILIKDLESNYYVKILTTKKEEEAYEKHLQDTGEAPLAFMVSLDSLRYDDDDFDILNARYFIEIQAANIIFDYYLYRYACVETADARRAYAKKHQLKLPGLRLMEPEEDYISKQLAPYFYANIEIAIYLQTFKETHEDITKPHTLKHYYIFIYIGYLIGWTYILMISLYTLQDIPLTLKILETIKQYSEMEEPFSQTIITYNEK